jgi:hypothetical protein
MVEVLLEADDLLFLDAVAKVQGAGRSRGEMVQMAIRHFRASCEARAGGSLSGEVGAGALGAASEQLE